MTAPFIPPDIYERIMRNVTPEQRAIYEGRAPLCDGCATPIHNEEPHTPDTRHYHPDCCPSPDCPQNDGGDP